ncbi:MAG: YbhB/YbcL family Raf kinase inhibitor-like protein [Solirubrobacteraceae bacterium]
MTLLVALLCASSCALALASGGGIRVGSPAFKNGATIPDPYTCAGAGESPPLHFSGVPRGAKSLALSVIDTDGSGTGPHGFTHWTVYDLSPKLDGLSARKVPSGARQGTNDFGHVGYGAPCPPKGKAHHYMFTLYALSGNLSVRGGAAPSAVERAIAAKQIAQGQLVGLSPSSAPHKRPPRSTG